MQQPDNEVDKSKTSRNKVQLYFYAEYYTSKIGNSSEFHSAIL